MAIAAKSRYQTPPDHNEVPSSQRHVVIDPIHYELAVKRKTGVTGVDTVGRERHTEAGCQSRSKSRPGVE